MNKEYGILREGAKTKDNFVKVGNDAAQKLPGTRQATLLTRLHSRGSRFLSYNFLQFAIDGKNNSKTKVEKAFFFIFMSSYAEMS
jgi:hypothetical protein